MALSDEQALKIDMQTRRMRTMGSPSSQREWITVISMLIQQPNDAIEEFRRQGRIYGVPWLVQATDALLDEIASGNTYRDEQDCLRIVAKRNDSVLTGLIS